MSVSASFLEFAQRQGLSLHAYVLARDDLQLGPALVSQAVARRLRQGLRALGAYLRRLLVLLALQLEPDLQPNPAPRVLRRSVRPAKTDPFRFRVLDPDRPGFDPWADQPFSDASRRGPSSGPVISAPLLARLAALKALLEAPQARAQRLAFHLARMRPGPLLAPCLNQNAVPRRFGTEISTFYAGLATAILKASWLRPSPLGPAARAPPRIRRL